MDGLLGPGWPDSATAWASGLIAEFGSLPATLSANSGDLIRIVPPQTAAFLARVQAVVLHTLKMPVYEGAVVTTSEHLLAYLKADMAFLGTERLRVLYLGSKGFLLADEILAQGCIGEVAIYPRQILKRALELGAAALILVHNHPSGDHRPSRSDIEATHRVANACCSLEISLHDHVVIGRSGWSSFRLLGLI